MWHSFQLHSVSCALHTEHMHPGSTSVWPVIHHPISTSSWRWRNCSACPACCAHRLSSSCPRALFPEPHTQKHSICSGTIFHVKIIRAPTSIHFYKCQIRNAKILNWMFYSLPFNYKNNNSRILFESTSKETGNSWAALQQNWHHHMLLKPSLGFVHFSKHMTDWANVI